MSLDTPTQGVKAVVGRTFRYRVVRPLVTRPGSEFALVYAPDGARNRIVVMKRLPPALAADAVAVAKFRAEAKIAARLDHPGIVKTLEVTETESEDFYTMEYMRGADMRRLMDALTAQKRTLPLDCVLLVAIEICNALDYAHSLVDAPVIHRELSPSKVLIGHDGKVKLTGFAAPPVARGSVRRSRSESLGYTSPERFVGEPQDARSDVFALGVLIYELSSGERLFGDAASDHEIMQKVLRGEVPRPSEVRRGYPRELETILMRALARDRSDRYPTAAALLADLETFLWSRWPTATTAALAKLVGEEFPWDDVPDTTIAEPIDSWVGPNPLAAVFTNGEPTPRPPRGTKELQKTAPARFPRSSSPVLRGVGAPPIAPPLPPPRPISDLVVPIEWEPEPPYDDDLATIAQPRSAITTAEQPPAMAFTPPPARRKLAYAVRSTRHVPAAAPRASLAEPAAAIHVVAPEVLHRIDVPSPRDLEPPKPAVATSERSRPRASRKAEPAKPKRTLFPPPERLPIPSTAGTLDGLPSIKAIDLDGGIALTGVRKSVEQTLSPLRGCYRAAARAKQQTPRVQLTIAFDVGERRVPSKIRTTGGAPLDSLATCAAKVAADIRDLPAPKGAGARVIVSVEFRPNPPSP
jgi:serine/threonine protein kinase